MATKQNQGQEEKITALYGRLSDDDGVDMESNSISNQRTILQDYAKKNGYLHPVFFYEMKNPKWIQDIARKWSKKQHKTRTFREGYSPRKVFLLFPCRYCLRHCRKKRNTSACLETPACCFGNTKKHPDIF